MSSRLVCSLLTLSAVAIGACERCDSVPSAQGSASASWSITAHGQTVACARAGAASVSVRLHHRDSGVDTVFSFACATGQGTTPPIAIGLYDVTLTLQAADSAPLVAAPAQAAIAIARGDTTALPLAVFPVVDSGQLVLSFSTLGTASNCAAPDRDGAGLTGFTLSLEHASDGCAAVKFTRARGTTILGTYTVDCGSPPVTACIERDETLTVDGMASGPYALGAHGFITTLACWAGADVLSVPAGAITTQRIELTPTHIPGC